MSTEFIDYNTIDVDPAKTSNNTIQTYKQIDKSILKALSNPEQRAYEIKIKIPECTFLGVQAQPDFAVLYLTFYPKDKIIELKSLKQYVFQLRNIVVSYECLINIFYDHLMEVYKPERLRIVMVCNPLAASAQNSLSTLIGRQEVEANNLITGNLLTTNGK